MIQELIQHRAIEEHHTRCNASLTVLRYNCFKYVYTHTAAT